MAENYTLFNPFAYPNSPPGQILVDPPTANRPLEEKGPPYMLRTDKRVFDWVVKQVDILGSSSESKSFIDNCIPSPQFSCGGWANYRSSWRLQFNQHYWENGTRYVSLYLWLQQNGCAPSISCTYQFDILNSDGNAVASKRSGIRGFKINDCYGWQKFAKYSEVMDHLVEQNFLIRVQIEILGLQSENLSLQKPLEVPNFHSTPSRSPSICHIEEVQDMEMGSPDERVEITEQSLNNTGRVKLSKQARRSMRKYRDIPDGPVEIRTTLELFRVNKLLIAARSNKLYKLIQPESPASPTPRLDLLEEDNFIVRSLCEYLYTNQAKLLLPGETFENQMKLFEMAVKYEISDLIKAAFQALCHGVSTQTWLEVLKLYREHESEFGDLRSADNGKTLKHFFTLNRRPIMEIPEVKTYFKTHSEFLMKLLVL